MKISFSLCLVFLLTMQLACLPARAAFRQLPVVTTCVPAETVAETNTAVTHLTSQRILKRVHHLLKSRLFQRLLRPGGGFARNQIVAFFMALLLGSLGVHRFYLGYILEGILQLLLVVGPLIWIASIIPISTTALPAALLLVLLLAGISSLASIWVIVDLVRIATGELKPKEGSYDTTF